MLGSQLLMAGCHSARSRVCAEAPVVLTNSDSVTVEVRETVVVDTVTVAVTIPAESRFREVHDTVSFLTTSYAESRAWINADGSLGHSLSNRAASIPAEVLVPVRTTSTNRVARGVREIPVQVPCPYEVERNPSWWERFRLGAFWYLVAIAGCTLLWTVRKPLLSVLLRR